MDPIDIHMQVPRVEYQKLRDMRKGESSAEVRVRVEAALERQRERFRGMALLTKNVVMPKITSKKPSMIWPLGVFYLNPFGQTRPSFN